MWQPEQIVSLFDSLLKNYPISTFLFWSIQPERRSDWDIYKFMENFRHGDVHNELVEPDGREVTLVLDGQQRLTSLLVGLQGSYTVRPKYARRTNGDTWVRQRLYLDLLKDPAQVEDDEDADQVGVTYGFRFAPTQPVNTARSLWFKVGQILDCTSDDAFEVLLASVQDQLPDTATRIQQRLLANTLTRLYRVVWKEEVVSYFTELDQSYDRVLDIFIRANDGGTKLSKSDLLLSTITSNWQGVSAREQIYDFVSRINEGLGSRNDIDKDLIMKACLVLSDLDPVYKVGNFTRPNLAVIENNWPRIKQSLEATFRLINRFGVDAQTLTSGNAVLPVAYYLFRTGADLTISSEVAVRNARLVQRWLIGSLLNGVFGGNSDTTISAARATVREALETSEDFPYRTLVDALARRGRLTEFDDNNIESLLDTRYGRRTCFLALALLYDTTTWGLDSYHIDHIIPRALADRKALMAANVPETRILRILDSVDRIGNLELLLGRENLEKSDTSFDHWFQTRDAEFLDRHHIPNRPDLFNILMLPEFVAEREQLILRRLRAGLVVAAAEPHSDMGGVSTNFR